MSQPSPFPSMRAMILLQDLRDAQKAISAEEVLLLRETNGCGLLEARATLKRRRAEAREKVVTEALEFLLQEQLAPPAGTFRG